MPERKLDAEHGNKLAFQEEGEFLDGVETRIDKLIEPHTQRIKRLEKSLSNWHAVDYEDIDRKKIALSDLERSKERQAELEAVKPSPYFCHFELEIDGEEIREFCIGEQDGDLRDGLGPVVLGRWSPLRRVYINKTQREFVLEESGKEHKYKLRLRRMVRIKDATLLDVNTELDSADTSLEGEIVDSFLLEVLRDKRRDFKLSNIIKTIQQNQNDILERPVDESFVVQGCAGSGKTMILLHRLSYLASNYPKLDFSKYIVLTPSESFNKHIDDLAEELNIGSIMRMTVESYYVRLARLLSRNDMRISVDRNGRKSEVPKVDILADNVVSELELPADYLSEVYSEEYAEQVKAMFKNAKDAAIAEMDASPVKALLDSHGAPLLDGLETPYAVYLAITRVCTSMRREAASAEEELASAQKEKTEAEEELETTRHAIDSAIETLEPLRAVVKARTVPVYELKSSENADLKRRAANAQTRVKRARDKVEAASLEVKEAEEIVGESKAKTDNAREAISRVPDVVEAAAIPSVMEKAEVECADEAAEVARLQSELDGIGIFAFGRRRQLREDLQQADERLKSRYDERLHVAAEEYVADAHSRLTRSLGDAEKELADAQFMSEETKEALAAASNHLELELSEYESIKAESDRVRREAELLKMAVSAFEDDEYPNLALEDVEALRDVAPELVDYALAFRGLKPNQVRYLRRWRNRIRVLEGRVRGAGQDLQDAEAKMAACADEDAIAMVESLGASLDVSSFESVMSDSLAAMQSRLGIVLPKGKRYRYELYLKALECVLYYGPIHDQELSICVDEAQDLSIAEHELIRMAVGPEAAINLYGDTMQSIFPYRGIKDWSDLPDDIVRHKYVLNENYRNTSQITEYCNERLGMNAIAVGLKGSKVSRSSLSSAIGEMFAIRGANPNARCAVLYKRGLTGVKASLVEHLGLDASFGVVDTSRVSVLPVDAAKGIEFDAVVVIDNGMSNNERYIACTRPLEHLFMTHVKGAETEGPEEISVDEGRTVGATKLREAHVKRVNREVNVEQTPVDEVAVDPFFDLDFG